VNFTIPTMSVVEETVQTQAQAPKTEVYAIDEAALCYHHHLIYEAKILKATSLDDENTSITGAIGPQYYVHYKGWKEKWNEWVPAERLLKKNPENLRLQASLKAAHPHLSGRGPGQAKSWGGSGISIGVKKRGRKRRREQVQNFLYRWCFLRIAPH